VKDPSIFLEDINECKKLFDLVYTLGATFYNYNNHQIAKHNFFNENYQRVYWFVVRKVENTFKIDGYISKDKTKIPIASYHTNSINHFIRYLKVYKNNL